MLSLRFSAAYARQALTCGLHVQIATQCCLCMFLGKDGEYLTESTKVPCKKVQRHHYLVELLWQGVEIWPRSSSTTQAACSSAQTVSMAPSARKYNVDTCSPSCFCKRKS